MRLTFDILFIKRNTVKCGLIILMIMISSLILTVTVCKIDYGYMEKQRLLSGEFEYECDVSNLTKDNLEDLITGYPVSLETYRMIRASGFAEKEGRQDITDFDDKTIPEEDVSIFRLVFVFDNELDPAETKKLSLFVSDKAGPVTIVPVTRNEIDSITASERLYLLYAVLIWLWLYSFLHALGESRRKELLIFYITGAVQKPFLKELLFISEYALPVLATATATGILLSNPKVQGSVIIIFVIAMLSAVAVICASYTSYRRITGDVSNDKSYRNK